MAVELLEVVKAGLLLESLDKRHLAAHVESVEDQQQLRDALVGRGLVAFVANGAVLPRASGADDTVMRGKGAVPFQSPPSLEVELQLANRGVIIIIISIITYHYHYHHRCRERDGGEAGSDDGGGRRVPRQEHPAGGAAGGSLEPRAVITSRLDFVMMSR